MSLASVGSSGSGSSGNSSLAWSMGNGGHGRLVLEFPFPLDKGWYQEQLCTGFHTFEHRKERTGFQHEFIVLRLKNGSVCRVERMGDPDARFEALSEVGSVASDMIQCFQSKKEAYLSTSKVIAQVVLPTEFDLLDILRICRAIHEGEKTRNYTLQVYNCYFFSLAIQVCLTRLVAHWEDVEVLSKWYSKLMDGVESLTDVFQPPAYPASLKNEPVLFRLFSILNLQEGYSGCTSLFLAQIKAAFKSRIQPPSYGVPGELRFCVNNTLWHYKINADLAQFADKICRSIVTDVIMESVDQYITMLAPSTETSDRQKLSGQLKSILTKAFLLGRSTAGTRTSCISKCSSGPRWFKQQIMHYTPIMRRMVEQGRVCTTTLTFDRPLPPQISRKPAADWYRWFISSFPYLFLWGLNTFFGVWGITIYDATPNGVPYVPVDKEMRSIMATVEGLETVTVSDVEHFVESVRALTANRVVVWDKNPWGSLYSCIKQHLPADILEGLEDNKPTVKFRSRGQPKFIVTKISSFQRHIFTRIAYHARTVERAYLGSAEGIQTELEKTLSQVWNEIRLDSALEKACGWL